MHKFCRVWIPVCAGLLFALQATAQLTVPDTQQPALAAQPSIPLDQAAADRYAGYYLIGPQRAVRYWREGDHFYFGAVGTPQRAEVVPQGSNRFSYANGSVTFTFNAGADGNIAGLNVNQAGREIQAPRIEEALAKSFAIPSGIAATQAPAPRTWPVMAVTNPTPITTSTQGVMDYWPTFSPDGKTVLFSRTLDGGKTWALFRVPTAGGTAKLFATLPVSATRGNWSAKTGRIVFNGDSPGGKSAIWVIDGDGRNAHPIATEGILVPSYPFWYPDGHAIGFGDAARNILYRMSEEGRLPTAITHQDQVLAGMSSISPDGQLVAFAGQKDSGQAYDQSTNQIWLVDNAGSSKTLEAQPLQGRTPSWSPDGKRLAFESNRGSPNSSLAIFIINRDGTGLIQVTDYSLNASHPLFSPDGRQLVFAGRDPSQLSTTIQILTLPASL